MWSCATSVAIELAAATPTTIKTTRTLAIADPELLQGLVRAAVPLLHPDVAFVLQVRDPHAARPEAARREIAEAVEERNRLAQLRVDLVRVRDRVDHLPALGVGTPDEALVEALLCEP